GGWGAPAFRCSTDRSAIDPKYTSNLDLAPTPGNVLLPAAVSGLPRDSVANVSQLLTLDRQFLGEAIGVLPTELAGRVAEGLRLVLAL
ncbi:MAG: type II toxin-antitoxin system PemK/MazF family toxin, partial [Candidatus Krumholzibacteriia bacterium]